MIPEGSLMVGTEILIMEVLLRCSFLPRIRLLVHYKFLIGIYKIEYYFTMVS